MAMLEERHVLITGGGSGIGAAVAAALAAEGAQLTLLGRHADTLEATAAGLPGDARTVIADVTDAMRLDAALAPLAHVDIVVNAAGNARTAPFKRTDADLWQEMLEVNLTGAYRMCQALIPAMAAAGWGRVINIASTAGLTGYAYCAAYCAAKHGLVGLTRALAIELAQSGVTVNAVCPGFTDTPMLARSLDGTAAKTGKTADVLRAEIAKVNPQGRLVRPEEVAEAVRWLCGPQSGAITGQAVAVAGGEVMP